MSRRPILAIAALALLLAPGSGVVPAVLAGGGCHAEANGSVHTDGPSSVVRMDVCSFSPTVARVPVGAEVRFLNTSTTAHVVLGRGQAWGGAEIVPGREMVQAFRESGIFPYSCPLHPGMVGAIVVGDVGQGVAAPADAPAASAPAVAEPQTATADSGVAFPLMATAGGVGLGILLAALVGRVRRRSVGSD